MSIIDHKAEAERLLIKGREVVAELRDAHSAGRSDRADELGKQATGIWAQAQAEATLALVEQQRIANLIAFMVQYESPTGNNPRFIEYHSEKFTEITKGLGL